MERSRRLEINDLALKVRRALDLDKTPFLVDEAVTRLGGSIVSIQSDADAFVRKEGDAFVIGLAEQPPTRRRFSIAHELGHLFLHMGYLIDKSRWESIKEYQDSPKFRYGFSEEEYEAHEFAGSILMPADEFRAAVRELSNDGRTPLGPLAAKFEVSPDAARTRGQWLGLFEWSR